MALDDGIQLTLPLDRGSYVVATLLCHRERDGWSVRILHRHSGEAAMCPSIRTYKALSLEEMQQTIEDELSGANGKFILAGGSCSPVRP